MVMVSRSGSLQLQVPFGYFVKKRWKEIRIADDNQVNHWSSEQTLASGFPVASLPLLLRELVSWCLVVVRLFLRASITCCANARINNKFCWEREDELMRMSCDADDDLSLLLLSLTEESNRISVCVSTSLRQDAAGC